MNGVKTLLTLMDGNWPQTSVYQRRRLYIDRYVIGYMNHN